ncbi:hypothetical protein [Nocardia wallacei]|uniref:hypothetical protein n=1 Tax=Nocardia wallacei TaxID=480035 RepID=UPI00245690F4|nr:hypothetical protein [Nocardia wallacei]
MTWQGLKSLWDSVCPHCSEAETAPLTTKTRARRAEPIDKRTAQNGAVTYTFQVDVGTKPDGTRDRQRFTYRTFAEARREYRRITTEVAEGRYIRLTPLTVDEGCDEWVEGTAQHSPGEPEQLQAPPVASAAVHGRQEVGAAHQGRW